MLLISLRAKKKKSQNKMFFLPHNLYCLCRKGNNPVWSHQSVQLIKLKWKNWKRGKMFKYSILYSSLLSVISICSAVYLLFRSWVFGQVNRNFKFQDDILTWKFAWLKIFKFGIAVSDLWLTGGGKTFKSWFKCFFEMYNSAITSLEAHNI